MKSARSFLAISCLLAAVSAGQSVNGHVFRHDKIGLTYAFPDNFSAKLETELPMRDPSGREHMVLALWSSPERSGPPQITLLYDTKARPADLSSAEIANHYLSAIRQMWVNTRGAKISGPQKLALPGCTVWRIDLFQPDTLPHYNAAVVLPLADHRLVAIQLNAASQEELDAEVDSLRKIRLDQK